MLRCWPSELREKSRPKSEETGLGFRGADALLITAILFALLLVILPIVAFGRLSGFPAKLTRSACSVTCILLSGYLFAILAHYRLLFGERRRGERQNPEPAEKWSLISTAIVSAVVFVVLLF